MTGRTPALMVQGAGSNVGKSLLVAGLCRAFTRQGLNVRPFKPQNMSNNAAVTMDGGEIGRAQAVQARACGVDPVIDMNPVLLKPETDIGAQVVVQGRRFTTAKARDYARLKPTLMQAVLDSYHRLAADADLVVVEGAGSPAEINLRQGDIANMGFAEAADLPVILAGDIDRGGVIAQLVGAHAVLPVPDRDRIAGFLINKFRGDVSLFDEGLVEIERRTGWPSLGVLPWFADAHRLPAEDAADLKGSSPSGKVKIAVPMLSRIGNFDDFDPLKQEPEVALTMIAPGTPLPGDADVVILPGSKSTRGDLAFLRAQGWDIDLQAHVRRGGRVLGLCAGLQMMGRTVADPEGIEGPAGETPGLGLLDVDTVMTPEKRLVHVSGRHIATGAPLEGYEMHIGETSGPDLARPWLEIDGRPAGAVSPDGLAAGVYVHGIFTSDAFRRAWLAEMGAVSTLSYDAAIDGTLDDLAAHVEAHLDLPAILQIAGVSRA